MNERDDFLPLTGLVIVIEDNTVVRMLLEESLTEMGFSSSGFDNASTAFEHLTSINGCCALIIADQGLPGGIKGAELVRIVKEKWPAIPSIITSGYRLDESLLPSYSSCLPKPYTLNELERTIREALDQ